MYFRIKLNYKNKYYEKENDLKFICDIYISYVKNNEKKFSNFKINILDFYRYFIKYYKEDDVVIYIKKVLCTYL